MSSCQDSLFEERCYKCNGWSDKNDPCERCMSTGKEEVAKRKVSTQPKISEKRTKDNSFLFMNDPEQRKMALFLLERKMKKNYQRSEMDAADQYGKLTPGSGNTAFEKGDVVGEGNYKNIRIENKFTEAKSFSLNKEYLIQKIKECLVLHGKELVMRVDFNGECYVVMRDNFFRSNFSE